MEEDEEFAAAVHATFAEIDTSFSGSISFDAFVSWWRRKEAETGGADPPDELLGDAWSLFEEFDLSGQGSGLEEPEALAEVLVGLELEGFAADPDQGHPGDSQNSVDLAATLLDGLDDLDSSEEEGEEEGDEKLELSAPDNAGDRSGVVIFTEFYTRARLEAMKMSELRQLAKNTGIQDRQLEDLLDSDEPKEALLSVLLRSVHCASQPDEGEPPKHAPNLPEGVVEQAPSACVTDGPDLELDGEGVALLAGLDDLDLSTSEEEDARQESDQSPREVAGDPALVASYVEDDVTAELLDAFKLIDAHNTGLLGPDEFHDLCNQLDPLMSEQSNVPPCQCRPLLGFNPDCGCVACVYSQGSRGCKYRPRWRGYIIPCLQCLVDAVSVEYEQQRRRKRGHTGR